MRIRRSTLSLALLLSAVCCTVRADDQAAATALLRSGDAAAALALAERASAADPRNARLRFLRGVILIDLGRDTQAAAIFQQLTEDFPQLPEPYNNLALLHARAGRLQEALQALEVALRNDPAQTLARQNLGDIHLRLAVQAWDTVATALPGDFGVQRRLQLARELMAATQ